MAAYQLIASAAGNPIQTVLRREDGAVIPYDDGNRDYVAFQAWLAEGNTADPAPEPAGVGMGTLPTQTETAELAADLAATEAEVDVHRERIEALEARVSALEALVT